MAPNVVDLNCDVGESYGPWRIEPPEAVFRHISSANVACGYHAGDPLVMEETVRRCKTHGVAVGAHPGYPDRMGFGRRAMGVSGPEVRAMVLYQVGALKAFCDAEGVSLEHVKLHGALYHAASEDEALAKSAIDALVTLRRWDLIVLARSGSALARLARQAGLAVAEEAFADRAYRRDGTLLPRSESGAVLSDPEEVARRAVEMVLRGSVPAVDGGRVALRPDSICVHGDHPGVLRIVEHLAAAFHEAGIRVAPLRDTVRGGGACPAR